MRSEHCILHEARIKPVGAWTHIRSAAYCLCLLGLNLEGTMGLCCDWNTLWVTRDQSGPTGHFQRQIYCVVTKYGLSSYT